MMTLHPNIYPKDGHYFIDTDGVTIRANSWRGVIARVSLYRRRNRMPPGDPVKDVVAQVCARSPGLCVEGATELQHRAFLKNHATLKSRVLTWLNEMLKKKAEATFVEDAVTVERADRCAGCPANKALSDGCASCKVAVRTMRKQLVGERHEDTRLHCCDILGEDLLTSTRMDLQAEDNEALPAGCWRKRA